MLRARGLAGDYDSSPPPAPGTRREFQQQQLLHVLDEQQLKLGIEVSAAEVGSNDNTNSACEGSPSKVRITSRDKYMSSVYPSSTPTWWARLRQAAIDPLRSRQPFARATAVTPFGVE